MAELGPDELSELAECLDDACQEAIRKGNRIRPCLASGDWKVECCPFGALLGTSYPFPNTVAAALSLPRKDVEDFMGGFDIETYGPYGPRGGAFALGRSFRERYVTGGGK